MGYEEVEEQYREAVIFKKRKMIGKAWKLASLQKQIKISK